MVGSSVWNGEVAGSSPVSYTEEVVPIESGSPIQMGCHVSALGGRKTLAMFLRRVRFSYWSTRFVGVMANPPQADRSVAMSSILIRTAHAAYALMAVCRSSKPEESVRITHAAQNAG